LWASLFWRTPPATAAQQYFSNLEALGADPKTIRTYRSAVDLFLENCGKTYVEDVTKQDIINFMGWLRKQPSPQRRNSNPDRTHANKVGHVAIFLKAFGVSRLLKRSEYPQYEEKMVTAHTDEELDSGDERNAAINYKLFAGRNYVARLRLNHPPAKSR
jgi:hypothetical protein